MLFRLEHMCLCWGWGMWSRKAFEEATAVVQVKDNTDLNEGESDGIREKW